MYSRLMICNFTGIKIWDAKVNDWTKLNVAKSINLFNPTPEELDDALCVAERDNFEHIICYRLSDNEFERRECQYTIKA